MSDHFDLILGEYWCETPHYEFYMKSRNELFQISYRTHNEVFHTSLHQE